ncbi:hypothetical protein SNE40_014935 [Patella caerulea]
MIQEVDSLHCYQCADSENGGGCKDDIQSLIDIRKTFENGSVVSEQTDPDIKDCSQFSEWNVCLIEEIKTRGEMLSYIRDCSDGLTFSFDSDEARLLRGLKPNNQTTCAYQKQGYQICVSICNTDLCNGPSNSAVVPLVTATLIVCLWFVFLIQ